MTLKTMTKFQEAMIGGKDRIADVLEMVMLRSIVALLWMWEKHSKSERPQGPRRKEDGCHGEGQDGCHEGGQDACREGAGGGCRRRHCCQSRSVSPAHAVNLVDRTRVVVTDLNSRLLSSVKVINPTSR